MIANPIIIMQQYWSCSSVCARFLSRTGLPSRSHHHSYSRRLRPSSSSSSPPPPSLFKKIKIIIITIQFKSRIHKWQSWRLISLKIGVISLPPCYYKQVEEKGKIRPNKHQHVNHQHTNNIMLNNQEKEARVSSETSIGAVKVLTSLIGILAHIYITFARGQR